MKWLRILLFAVLATIALVPCPEIASAAAPTSPAGTIYEGKVHATSEGHITIDNPIAAINCNSTLEGEVEPSGSVEPISIPLNSLSFTGCTNSWTATVNTLGTLEMHAISSNNGTVTWSGATITFSRFGINCRYLTSNTHIGTLTASKATGGTATIDLSGTLPFHSGSGLCGAGNTSFTGSYRVATPDYLDVDKTLDSTPTSPAGTTYTGTLHASSEGHIAIDNPIATINCSSTLKGAFETPESGEPIGIPLSSLTFTGCTNNWTATVNSPGKLEVRAIAGSKNGTVRWSGATISFTRFGLTCRYKTENTDVGTLTGSKTTGVTATIDLSGALPFHSGSPLCGEAPTSFTGSYSVGTPDYLDVDAEF